MQGKTKEFLPKIQRLGKPEPPLGLSHGLFDRRDSIKLTGPTHRLPSPPVENLRNDMILILLPIQFLRI